MVGLNCGEEVQQSRILGKWSSTIGYTMGYSPAGVYTIVKTSLVESFEDEWTRTLTQEA